MVEDRRAFAKTIAAPFEREKTVDARARFVELQATIEAIDRAIEDEEGGQGSVKLSAWASSSLGPPLSSRSDSTDEPRTVSTSPQWMRCGIVGILLAFYLWASIPVTAI